MLRQIPQGLCVLLVTLVSGCSSNSAGPPLPAGSGKEDGGRAAPMRSAPEHFLLSDEIRPGEALTAALPRPAIVAALTRWASTTVAAVGVPSGAVATLVTRPTGEWLSASAAGRIAYLLRDGVNPSRNSVEIVDCKRGWAKVLEPARNFAIVGFAFDSTATQLVYAELSLGGSSSRRVQWRTLVATLDTDETRVLQTSAAGSFADGAIPIPLGWSAATGALYFQGLLPFRGMVTHGIWATPPGDVEFRPVLAEAAYTGQPRLSRHGRYLARLETNLETLPADYIPSPGAAPGNVVVVSNLSTGEQTTLAASPGTVFGPVAWSASGNELVVSRRAWVEGRFRDVAFLRGRADEAFTLTPITIAPGAAVTDLTECGDGTVLWVEQDAEGGRLRTDDSAQPGTTLLTLPGGQIHVVGCLGD